MKKRVSKKKYSFEVHKYAPELNKVFIGNRDISNYFPSDVKRGLTHDYKNNLRAIRKHITFKPYIHYMSIAYIGDNSGFSKDIQGGFNSWQEVMPILHQMKDWFKSEEPRRIVKFMY